MGTRYITQKFDDLDGTVVPDEELETIRFSIDSDQYMLDLTREHAAQLRGALSPFVEKAQRSGLKARVASTSTAKSTATKDKNRTQELNKIREWANKNGYKVSARGRVPQDIVDAYEAASK